MATCMPKLLLMRVWLLRPSPKAAAALARKGRDLRPTLDATLMLKLSVYANKRRRSHARLAAKSCSLSSITVSDAGRKSAAMPQKSAIA